MAILVYNDSRRQNPEPNSAPEFQQSEAGADQQILNSINKKNC